MKRSYLLSIALLSFSFFACDQTIIVSGTPGSLSGKVTLWDEFGNSSSTAPDVTVEITGTTYNAKTDSEGFWTIQSLPPGIYAISVKKTGYAEYFNTSYQFVGNGDGYFGETDIIQLPSFSATLTKIELTDSTIVKSQFSYDSIVYRPDSTVDTIHVVSEKEELTRYGRSIYGTISRSHSNGNQDRVLVFVSRSSTIDPKNPSSYQCAFLAYANGTVLNGYGLRDELRKAGITNGETLYAVGYPTNPYGCDYSISYFDTMKKQRYYTSLGAKTETVSFTMK